MLAKGSPVPLYYQLAEHIRAQIVSGELQPGDRLPSERELSQQAGVSRMTARQALGYLTREGLLTVRHGLGAFVAAPKVAYSILNLRSFTESMAQQGRPVFSRLLMQAVIQPSLAVATALHLTGDQQVVKLVRLRGVDDLPLLLETSYVPSALCPGLEEADLTDGSLYRLLEQTYGLRVSHATQNIQAATANGAEQALFGLGPGSPMLLLEGVTFAQDERPLEYFKALYRGDHCSFVLQNQRRDTAGDSPVAQLAVHF